MSRLPDHTPELLAPVGSPEALLAAVRCGADAVYLGAGRFHARQHAAPFDEAALKETAAYCRERGVAVHLTLNTLVREDEFKAALADAERAVAAGVDALIVQDRGLAAAIHAACPDLPLHASTQLSCHTPQGVKKLAADGFSRVVLAREMSEDEIAACCAVDCEIETFVHGALCMSVSGQCFLSALLGGRSGNRGQCAQPCRLPFAVGKTPREEDRHLSLKDLSLFDRVQTLAAMGVTSLKIEGRMKRPEYVAAAVSVCRAALDGRPVDEQLLCDLRAIFSRSGFTDGYFTGKRDVTMFGSRTKEDVLAASAAVKRLQGLYHKEIPRVPVEATLSMAADTPLTLTLTDGTHTVSATGEPAYDRDAPLPDERHKAAVLQCGGTPFAVKAVTLQRAAGADAPLSAVKALRREAVERLLAARRTRETPVFKMPSPVPRKARPTEGASAVVVRLQNASQWSEALSATAALVVLPLSTAPQTLRAIAARMPTAVEVPRGMFGSEERLQARLCEAKQSGAVAAMVHNVGALPLCEAAGLAAVGGFGLHVFNSETLNVCAAQGLAAATLSFESAPSQARFADRAPLPVGRLVHGRLPLMLLRNCPASARRGCKDCRQDRVLIDRKGAAFPLVCENGCADLLNSVPLVLADRAEWWRSLAFAVLHMTTESADEVARLAAVYADAAHGRPVPDASALSPDGFTRGGKI